MQKGEPSGRMAFESFVREWRAVAREDFERNFSAPLLVQLNDPGGPDGVHAGASAFGTLCLDARAAAQALRHCYVQVVRKESANPFASMITVGRAPNNDVILAYEQVSKFHAFFVETPSGWSIVDAQSTNGTFIDGKRLAANVAHPLPLESGPVELGFAGVRARLFTPARFFEVVRLEASASAV